MSLDQSLWPRHIIPDWLGLSHIPSSVTGGTFSNTEGEEERSISLRAKPSAITRIQFWVTKQQLCPLQNAREEGIGRIKDSSTVWNTPEKSSKDKDFDNGDVIVDFCKNYDRRVAIGSNRLRF